MFHLYLLFLVPTASNNLSYYFTEIFNINATYEKIGTLVFLD